MRNFIIDEKTNDILFSAKIGVIGWYIFFISWCFETVTLQFNEKYFIYFFKAFVIFFDKINIDLIVKNKTKLFIYLLFWFDYEHNDFSLLIKNIFGFCLTIWTFFVTTQHTYEKKIRSMDTFGYSYNNPSHRRRS